MNLSQIRIKKGLTQKEVAEKIGVFERTIRRWENLETEPRLSDASKLAKLYGVSVEEVLTAATGPERKVV